MAFAKRRVNSARSSALLSTIGRCEFPAQKKEDNFLYHLSFDPSPPAMTACAKTHALLQHKLNNRHLIRSPGKPQHHSGCTTSQQQQCVQT